MNGKRADKKLILNEHDLISVYIADEVLDSFKNDEKMLSPSLELESLIFYEDENIILINKPRGLLVQKDSKNVKALDDMVISYLTEKKEYDEVFADERKTFQSSNVSVLLARQALKHYFLYENVFLIFYFYQRCIRVKYFNINSLIFPDSTNLSYSIKCSRKRIIKR